MLRTPKAPLALVSESLLLANRTSSVVITELDDTNSEDLSEADFDESLALLTNTNKVCS